jgi:hypothetical protein
MMFRTKGTGGVGSGQSPAFLGSIEAPAPIYACAFLPSFTVDVLCMAGIDFDILSVNIPFDSIKDVVKLQICCLKTHSMMKY